MSDLLKDGKARDVSGHDAEVEKIVAFLEKDDLLDYKKMVKEFLIMSIQDGLPRDTLLLSIYNLHKANYKIVSKLEALEKRLDGLASQSQF